MKSKSPPQENQCYKSYYTGRRTPCMSSTVIILDLHVNVFYLFSSIYRVSVSLSLSLNLSSRTRGDSPFHASEEVSSRGNPICSTMNDDDTVAYSTATYQHASEQTERYSPSYGSPPDRCSPAAYPPRYELPAIASVVIMKLKA